MNKKEKAFKISKGLKVEDSLQVEDSIINSSSYDEIKYIDEWIAYMKDSNYSASHSMSSDCEEDSSFSSIMNFYLSGDEKINLSREDRFNRKDNYENHSSSDETLKTVICREDKDEEKLELKLVGNYEESEEVESVDLCHKENLVDSEIINSEQIYIKNINNEQNLSNTEQISINTEPNYSNTEQNYSNTEQNYIKNEQNYLDQSSNINNEISNSSLISNDVGTRHPSTANIKDTENYIKYDNTLPKNISNPIIVNVTKFDSPIYFNKRIPAKPILSQYFSDESSPNSTTFGLINEAKNRAMQQNKRSQSDIPLRKFVIDTEQTTMNIQDIWKLNDLKNKPIIGKLSKMSTKGYYTENWVTLRENFFSCYSTKINKKSPTCIMNEKNGDMENPLDSASFFTRKYSIDLLNSRLYLCKKKGKSGIFSCYSEAIPAETDLVDVTDLVILNIKESPFGYKVFLKKDTQNIEITLNCLNFAIKTNDGYRFYKVNSLTEFLTWNVAFRFRLSQIPLNIG